MVRRRQAAQIGVAAGVPPVGCARPFILHVVVRKIEEQIGLRFEARQDEQLELVGCGVAKRLKIFPGTVCRRLEVSQSICGRLVGENVAFCDSAEEDRRLFPSVSQ
jgi:hypothetical protein